MAPKAPVKKGAANQKAAKGKQVKAKSVSSVKGKKKWSGPRTKEKIHNSVLLSREGFDKLCKEVPSMRVITVATVSDRLKVNGSLARHAIAELASRGLIKPVIHHSSFLLYTRLREGEEKPAQPVEVAASADSESA